MRLQGRPRSQPTALAIHSAPLNHKLHRRGPQRLSPHDAAAGGRRR